MKMVKLKNGSEEAGPAVAVIMAILQTLFDDMEKSDMLSSLMLWDLGSYCQDNTQPFHGDKLVKIGLMTGERGSYEMHDTIKNVVRSSLTIVGMDIKLVSPVGNN
tara:strand:- start:6711 stop:7025 length:315 start_codon:yes stop_codon:yes gene_type:complete